MNPEDGSDKRRIISLLRLCFVPSANREVDFAMLQILLMCLEVIENTYFSG
ncbi:MAG: hypothetical protein Hyperionvirus11_4 [Hyperionvirus sp.]|uniref:Uncharacterized protein n=1 Tax=Hyperionvirus sp. TaxID=2487770 RepID=A0A3G5ABP3_9VIRU|nr:MAG: hypothetical protein Hyperionvirus11_4 [Hyperionvirus sp.]